MVAGIDFSSRAIDIVLLSEDDDSAVSFTWQLWNGDAFDRARRIRAAMPSRSFWEDNGVIAIGIEDPRGPHRNVDSVLYRVQGGILACLPADLLVQPWKPGEWRKQVGISNRGKQAPRDYAETHWLAPPAELSQDECDAYCIATATRQRIQTASARAATAPSRTSCGTCTPSTRPTSPPSRTRSRQHDRPRQDTALIYEPVTSGIEASSAEQALKKWADNAPGGTIGGKYVELACRSFKPTKVTFSTQTVVKLG